MQFLYDFFKEDLVGGEMKQHKEHADKCRAAAEAAGILRPNQESFTIYPSGYVVSGIFQREFASLKRVGNVVQIVSKKAVLNPNYFWNLPPSKSGELVVPLHAPSGNKTVFAQYSLGRWDAGKNLLTIYTEKPKLYIEVLPTKDPKVYKRVDNYGNALGMLQFVYNASTRTLCPVSSATTPTPSSLPSSLPSQPSSTRAPPARRAPGVYMEDQIPLLVGEDDEYTRIRSCTQGQKDCLARGKIPDKAILHPAPYNPKRVIDQAQLGVVRVLEINFPDMPGDARQALSQSIAYDVLNASMQVA